MKISKINHIKYIEQKKNIVKQLYEGSKIFMHDNFKEVNFYRSHVP